MAHFKIYLSHYILFTISLNLSPLTSKFLNISKLAQAGESVIISPFSAIDLAILTTSSKLSPEYTVHEFLFLLLIS